MPISFNQVPTNLRVPFVYVEFDGSRAQQGLAQQPFKTLALGQKIAAGTATALEIVRVTSNAQAVELFGPGSMLANMIEAYLANDSFTELFVLPIVDDGGAVAATGTMTIGGAPTAAGTMYFYVAGRRMQIGILSSDTPALIAGKVIAAVTAQTDLPVTAVVGINPEDIDFTAKNAGLVGNDIDLRLNYFDGEVLASGVTVTLPNPANDRGLLSGGTGTIDPVTTLAAIPEEQYNVMINPYTDAAFLTALENELDERAGPLEQIEGVALASSAADFATVTTLGDSRNGKYSSIMSSHLSPTTPWEWAAAIAGNVAFYGAIDQARPFQTLELKSIKSATLQELFTLSERNALLFNGIATSTTSSDGTVRVERVITTYQENDAGAEDTAFLDVNTALTLSYLRFSLRNRWLTRFPRHKLANDGTRFAAGQAVVTPKIAKGEIITLFREWEEIGLVEGFDQFKTDLIVERNVTDPNRLDVLMSPDLINQLRITAAKIQFLL